MQICHFSWAYFYDLLLKENSKTVSGIFLDFIVEIRPEKCTYASENIFLFWGQGYLDGFNIEQFRVAIQQKD